MSNSRREKRMKQFHARRRGRVTTLNMVSLMDIFTILVFFLLVNTSGTEVLPSHGNIVLPDASSDKLPVRNLVIAVDTRVIRLQGKPIVTVKEALQAEKSSIRPLHDALRAASATVRNITDKQGVTIMGDQEISYELLKKIMLTCTGAEYTNISFAVNQKAAGL
jgi:biopolymer transport protein TolR